jgi:Zn-dependent peptidase ImmA (M78 family)/DNA-binding XRE family transcriptional regulator
MREIFSKRLLNARKQANLSQDELVELINGKVKKTAIAKYERGEMMADADVVIALAKALGQRVDYFYRPFNVVISNVEFRAKASLGSRREESLRQMISSRIERYVELEQLLNVSSRFENPLKDFIIASQEDAEVAARELNKAWHLGTDALGKVTGILEDNGIKVIEIEADIDFDGYSALVNGNIPVIVLRSNLNTTERKRLTALHELAHLLFKFADGISPNDKERMCSRFAGALLLPAENLHSELGRFRSTLSGFELGLLKDKYGISALAIVVRAYQLNIITNFTQIKLINYCRQTKLETHIGSNKSTDNASRFELLLSRALTEDIISQNKAAELAFMTLDDFLTKYQFNDKASNY